jgi:hypothetical protein
MPPAIEVTLPSASTSEARYLGYERHVGGLAAQLAGCIGFALWERANGMISPATRRIAGELIYELLRFKMCLPEFDDLARAHGKQVFREYVSAPSNQVKISEGQIGELIEQALGLLSKIAKTKCN